MGISFSKTRKCCGTCKNWDGIKTVRLCGFNVSTPDNSTKYKCNVQMNGIKYTCGEGMSCFKYSSKF